MNKHRWIDYFDDEDPFEGGYFPINAIEPRHKPKYKWSTFDKIVVIVVSTFIISVTYKMWDILSPVITK